MDINALGVWYIYTPFTSQSEILSCNVPMVSPDLGEVFMCNRRLGLRTEFNVFALFSAILCSFSFLLEQDRFLLAEVYFKNGPLGLEKRRRRRDE